MKITFTNIRYFSIEFDSSIVNFFQNFSWLLISAQFVIDLKD